MKCTIASWTCTATYRSLSPSSRNQIVMSFTCFLSFENRFEVHIKVSSARLCSVPNLIPMIQKKAFGLTQGFLLLSQYILHTEATSPTNNPFWELLICRQVLSWKLADCVRVQNLFLIKSDFINLISLSNTPSQIHFLLSICFDKEFWKQCCFACATFYKLNSFQTASSCLQNSCLDLKSRS